LLRLQRYCAQIADGIAATEAVGLQFP